MTQHGDPGVGRTNPGWYPDPSWPSVVRWWDGKGWTKHTAPNDAKALSRRAPLGLFGTIILVVGIVVAVLGLVGAAYTLFMAWAISQWASNK